MPTRMLMSRAAYVALCLLTTTLVHAQGSQSHLTAAEAAYGEIDFEAVLREASAALESGGNTAAQLERVYELIGIAAAATGDEERSRDAYVKMLALNPEAQVDTNLAPRLRSPFMEARGFWSSRTDRLEVEVRLVRRDRSVRVVLSDPLDMAVEVRVRTRIAGEFVNYDDERVQAAPSTLVEVEGLPDAPQIEYVLDVLDGFGNRLASLGNEDEPRVLGDAPVTQPIQGGGQASDGGGGGMPIWAWVAIGVVAAGAITTGVVLGTRTKPITLESGIAFQ